MKVTCSVSIILPNDDDRSLAPIDISQGCIKIDKGKIIQQALELMESPLNAHIGFESAIDAEVFDHGLAGIEIPWMEVRHHIRRACHHHPDNSVRQQPEISSAGKNNPFSHERKEIDGELLDARIRYGDGAGLRRAKILITAMNASRRKHRAIYLDALAGKRLKSPSRLLRNGEAGGAVCADAASSGVLDCFYGIG